MERDDIIEYSLYNHHDEAHGKKVRKMIWMTTIILTIITGVEIFMGVKFSKGVMESNPSAWMGIKIGYIILTIVKAGFIVLRFMHLGDERKTFKYVILLPYITFIIYLVFICLYEGTSVTFLHY